MAKNVWLKKFLLGLAGGAGLRQLNKASKNCRASQEKVLRGIMSYAADTVFGKEHDFKNVKTPEDFRKAVSISDFEDYRPYITRHAKGEENVLFPGKPVMYATTSGTTREPKKIPISKKYMNDTYKKLSKIWLYTCVKENPDIFDGHDLSIVSKAVEGRTEDGTPYGAMGGHLYKTIPGFMRDIHCVPYSVYCIDDYESKYYTLCRITVEYPISYAITPNPSTFVQIIRKIKKNSGEIIKDIAEGTLSQNARIDPEIRAEIEAGLKPNPERAAELRKILAEKGELTPKYIWPGLALVNVWRCGNNGLYLKNIENDWPERTVIREFAYQASECRGGIVLTNDDLASVMTCHMNYFEFIREEDLDHEDPPIVQAWELEEGRRYNMLITTYSGLYRYDMNDIMQCDGHYNEFPKLRFIQKGAGVTSMTGEKLYERQLIEAMHEAEKELGLETSFFIGFADINDSLYRLYCEFKTDVPEGKQKELAALVDSKLKEFNPEYEAKRGTDRIKDLVLKPLVKDSFEQFKFECVKRGSRDGQFKIMHLMDNQDKQAIFEGLIK